MAYVRENHIRKRHRRKAEEERSPAEEAPWDISAQAARAGDGGAEAAADGPLDVCTGGGLVGRLLSGREDEMSGIPGGGAW